MMLNFKPRAKPEERRRTERHAMRGMGKILGGTGSLPRDCWISDISDGGARLHSEADIPDEFVLALPQGGRRECRVVWRLGHEAGVSFTDSFMPGFGQRTAGR
jgi:PilZ domain-containing protein